MNIFEIVSAIALIIACVFIIIVVLVKDTKSNMSQAISGGSSDNFFQKNAGRTKEARLNRTTVVATVVFFVLALAVNIINVHSKPAADTESGSSVTESVSSGAEDESDITIDDSSSVAEDDGLSAESGTSAESEASTESESAADSAVSESDSSAADESASE